MLVDANLSHETAGHSDLYLRHLIQRSYTMVCLYFFHIVTITTYTIIFQSSRGLDPETNAYL